MSKGGCTGCNSNGSQTCKTALMHLSSTLGLTREIKITEVLSIRGINSRTSFIDRFICTVKHFKSDILITVQIGKKDVEMIKCCSKLSEKCSGWCTLNGAVGDHVIAQNNGGITGVCNLRAVCNCCNSKKLDSGSRCLRSGDHLFK